MIVVAILSFVLPFGMTLCQFLFYGLFVHRAHFALRTRWLAIAWGSVVAIALSGVVQIFFVAPFAAGLYADATTRLAFESSVAGPLVEEVAKGLFPYLLWVFGGAKCRRALFVAGALSGAGFFMTESILALLGAPGSEAWRFQVSARVLFLACLHGIYTGFVGLGIGFAANSRSRLSKIAYTAIGLGIGTLLHCFFNLMALAVNDGHSVEGWALVESTYLLLCTLFFAMMIFVRLRVFSGELGTEPRRSPEPSGIVSAPNVLG